MAVTKTVDKTILRLEYDAGMVDEKQRYKRVSYSNVKSTATDEEMFITGSVISDLQDRVVLAIKRNEENSLLQA